MVIAALGDGSIRGFHLGTKSEVREGENRSIYLLII